MYNPYLDLVKKIYPEVDIINEDSRSSLFHKVNPDLNINDVKEYLDAETRSLVATLILNGFSSVGTVCRYPIIKHFGFAIPNTKAIETICKYSPVIEMGAGLGYWAMMLQEAGCEVEAYDDFSWKWETGTEWFPVRRGAENSITKFSTEVSLFLCWPNYASNFASNCLSYYKGNTLIYIGEGNRGYTADASFHDTLYSEWEIIESVDIPQWEGINDDLNIYRRKNAKTV